MIEGKTVLGIIPARGGSKGLPRKNLLPLHGKPLLAWSIAAGKASRYLDKLVVSTDDEEIAAISRQHGAEVPFMRPAELATDTASSFDVVQHVLEFFREQQGREFDYLVLLEPTSPLRETADIDAALEELNRHPDAQAIVGICQAESIHPAFMVRRGRDGRLRGYEEAQVTGQRRQEVEELFFLEGTVYISRVATYLTSKTFYHNATLGLVVPKWKSPEVDDIYDFLAIEATMRFHGDRYGIARIPVPDQP